MPVQPRALKLPNGIRAADVSSPGRRSPDTSIATSRRFGDGRSTRGCPSIAIGMPETRLDLRLHQRTGRVVREPARGGAREHGRHARSGRRNLSGFRHPRGSRAGLSHEAVRPHGTRRGARAPSREPGSARRQDSSRSSVVTGEPGVGKTRLVLEFARSIAVHATVLVGRCDREALVAYAPWVAILQWMIRTTAAQALRRHLAGHRRRQRAGANRPGDRRRAFTSAQPPVPATPDGRRYRLFEAASAAACGGVTEAHRFSW